MGRTLLVLVMLLGPGELGRDSQLLAWTNEGRRRGGGELSSNRERARAGAAGGRAGGGRRASRGFVGGNGRGLSWVRRRRLFPDQLGSVSTLKGCCTCPPRLVHLATTPLSCCRRGKHVALGTSARQILRAFLKGSCLGPAGQVDLVRWCVASPDPPPRARARVSLPAGAVHGSRPSRPARNESSLLSTRKPQGAQAGP